MVKPSEIPKAIRNPKNALKVAKSRFNFSTGKLLFKNTAGLESNLMGKKSRKELKKIQLKFKIKPNGNQNASELEKIGHTYLGHIFDEKLIERLSNRFNEIIENDEFSFVRSQYKGQVFSRQIRLAHLNIPEIKKLLNEKVVDLLEQYYKTPFKVVDVFAWRNYHVPPEIAKKHEIFSSYWHCDGRDTTWTKLFVHVSDVTEDDGPFMVQTIERTKELVKQGFQTRQNPGIPIKILEDPKYVTKCTGTKGTTLVANLTLSFHRASIPSPGHHRDLIQFQFAPSDEFIEDNWPEKLESTRDYNERLEEHNASNQSIT